MANRLAANSNRPGESLQEFLVRLFPDYLESLQRLYGDSDDEFLKAMDSDVYDQDCSDTITAAYILRKHLIRAHGLGHPMVESLQDLAVNICSVYIRG